MPVPVSAALPYLPLAATRVAQPVAAPHGARWAEALGFLLGRVKHTVLSYSDLPQANGTVRGTYVRSPGASVAAVVIETNPGASTGALCTVTATLGGTSTLAGTTTLLDGGTPLPCQEASARHATEYVRYFDVSGLTAGTAYDLAVTTATSGATASQGVYRVGLFEVPRATLAPEGAPSTEPGVNYAFAAAGNPVFAGSASTTADAAAGTERWFHQLDQARAGVRRFQQIGTVESTTHAWSTTSLAFADLDWKYGSAVTPHLYTRAKRLYAAGVTNKLTARVRVMATAGRTLELRFTNSAGTTFDLSHAGTGSWAWETKDVELATDQTPAGFSLQDDYWTVTAKLDAAGTGYCCAIALYDEES